MGGKLSVYSCTGNDGNYHIISTNFCSKKYYILSLNSFDDIFVLNFFPADPLAHIMQAFREHLLEKALYSLLTPGYENEDVIGPRRGTDG